MGNTAWVEARLALTGCWRLARGDRGGLFCFDRSLDGFWRSFRAAVIAYPLYLVLLAMRVSVAEWESSGGWRIVAVETIGYVIGWVAFPLLMLTVTQRLGRAHRFFDFMVPYNWCQLPQSALFVLVGLGFASGMLGPQSGEGIGIVAAVATLIYELYVWYIARVALDTTGLAAAFIALLDFALGVVISQVTVGLY
jgi:biotin transporter BioY